MADTSISFTWVFDGSIVAYFSITVRFRAVCRFSYDGTPEIVERIAKA
jgi:hypothetical protein